jgi:hypothetical protein
LPVALLFFLTACATDLASFSQKYTTEQERLFAHSYLRLVAGGQLDSAYSLLSPDLRDAKARQGLSGAEAALSKAQLDSLHPIGVNIGLMSGVRSVNLTYEMPTSDSAWVIANVATRASSGKVQVIGISAYRAPRSLEAQNAFTLRDRSFRHFLWLGMAILMPVVTFATAIMVARAKKMPRKWLWVLAALVGTPVFALNWTTGEVSTRGTLFLLFGASTLRSGAAAPWIISWAVPLGALVAYFKMRRWRARLAASGEVAA